MQKHQKEKKGRKTDTACEDKNDKQNNEKR